MIENVCIFDGNTMNHAFFAMSSNTCFTTSYYDIFHVDVSKVRCKLNFGRLSAFLSTNMVIKIGCLEYNGLIIDVSHVDIAHVDIFCSTTTTNRTLEAKSCVSARESIIVYVDILHSTRELTSDNETTVSMVNDIILYVDVLTWTVF